MSCTWLAGHRAPLWAAAAGMALSLGAVGPGWVFDDYILALRSRGTPPVLPAMGGPLDLFTFATGRANENRALMEQGLLLPWWSDAHLKIAFFRPLSALTHRLDFALFPDAHRLMYAHSLLWLGCTIAVVGWLYRRLDPSLPTALLATVLFAIDPTHAPVVGWLSNRNALIATTFGVLAILAHDRARRGAAGARPSGECRRLLRAASVAGPIFFFVGLLAGEFAVASWAYLVAYACTLERGRIPARLWALTPYAGVTVAWRMAYDWAGYGVHASGAYLDPVKDARAFWFALPHKVTVLLGAELGMIPSDFFFLAAPQATAVLLAITCVVLSAVATLIVPLLRRDRLARFWGLGMVLSCVPIAASFPSDRLLLFVGIGAMGLMARLIAPLFIPGLPRPSGARRAMTIGFTIIHLIAAPLLLAARSLQMQWTARALDVAEAQLRHAAKTPGRTAIIVNPPVDFFASYLQARAAWSGAPRFEHLYWLSNAGSALELTREGPSTLTVRREGGFLRTPVERLYRADQAGLGIGATVELQEMTAEVVTVTPDGRPSTVRFSFRAALESSTYSFVAWKRDRYEPLAIPAVGEARTFAAEDLASIVTRSGLERP